MDQNYFKEELYRITKRSFDVVSTIDHPYASPPIRLIDGHNKLKLLKQQKLNPLILIWDVNYPNAERHRYELSLDTGILSNKRDNFFIFNDKMLYPLQQPKCINFEELKNRLELVLQRMQWLPKKKRLIRDTEFIDNFDRIATLYAQTIKGCSNGTVFYQILIEKLYELIGLTELSTFFTKSSVSFFNSLFIDKWIPFCIESTKNKSYGFLSLLNHNLFSPPYFHGLDINKSQDILDKEYIKENIETIVSNLLKKKIIPFYEIFFWTLALANIKHYGNDYGFFDKLKKLNYKYNLGFGDEIQLTKHNDDSRFVILFEKDRSFSCFRNNDEYIIKKNNPATNSRISSLTAIYCHLGDRLNIILQEILSGNLKTPRIIRMGELNL